jgi:hypothetical protein
MKRAPLLAAVLAAALLLPVPAAASAERRATGILVEYHGDRLDGRKAAARYQVASPSGAVNLAGPQDPKLVGRRVTVVDGNPTAPGMQGRARASEGGTGVVPAAGSLTTLVILVATSDAAQTITVGAAREAVFTDASSASALFMAQSGGTTRLTGIQRGDGDVAGPFALSMSGAGCPYGPLADAADAAASSAGWTPAGYHHVLYVLPGLPDCDWGGLASMPGRRAWTNGYLATSVIAHEIGHNRGAHHASSLHCVGSSGDAVTLSSSCSSNEYGDPFDVMALNARLMSSFHRAQVGDLPADDQRVATRSGSFPLGASGEGDELLLVPRKTAGQPVREWYALERRTSRPPFDSFEPGSPITTGVAVRLVPALDQAVQTRLLDMTPATGSLDDAMLQPGTSFTDPELPIMLSVDGSGQSISVAMPALVDDVPPTVPGAPWAYTEPGLVRLRWWEASDDTGIERYEVSRGESFVGTTGGTSYDDAVTGPATLTYRVVAVDTSGNRASYPAITVYAPAPVGPTSGNATPGPYTSVVTGVTTTTTSTTAGDTGPSDLGPATDERDAPRTARRVGEIRRLGTRMRRRRHAWVIVLRVGARHATRMTATVNGRRIARSFSDRMTVRFRFPDRASRRTVRIAAWNASSRRTTSWRYSR